MKLVYDRGHANRAGVLDLLFRLPKGVVMQKGFHVRGFPLIESKGQARYVGGPAEQVPGGFTDFSRGPIGRAFRPAGASVPLQSAGVARARLRGFCTVCFGRDALQCAPAPRNPCP